MSDSEVRTNFWFPSGKNNESGWKLDIVSLLAVIGESSMDSHIQILTSSWYCILPRLIPAPQALLKPSRPSRLPQMHAAVVGVHNGVFLQSLNYFPEILHPIDDLPAFSFKVLKITHKKDKKRKPLPAFHESQEAHRYETERSLIDSDITPGVVESGQEIPARQSTIRNLRRALSGKYNRPWIPARKASPLTIITIASFLWTCALVVWAFRSHDGVAILAILTMSMVSSLVGIASWWQPVLMNRPSKAVVPPGDVVIKTREGAFVLVKCDEQVSRELYTGTEECKYYVTTDVYQKLVGIGTVLLMISVVLLGNCKFNMQAAIGITYMVLNGVFWAVSLIDNKRFWNLSYYDVKDITPKDSQNAHEKCADGEGNLEDVPSFTRTMWYAIRETKKIGWVKSGKVAPKTAGWDEWLAMAEQHANRGNRSWRAVEMRDKILSQGVKATPGPINNEYPVQEQIPAYAIPPQESR